MLKIVIVWRQIMDALLYEKTDKSKRQVKQSTGNGRKLPAVVSSCASTC
jgi:hypothetical protein